MKNIWYFVILHPIMQNSSAPSFVFVTNFKSKILRESLFVKKHDLICNNEGKYEGHYGLKDKIFRTARPKSKNMRFVDE